MGFSQGFPMFLQIFEPSSDWAAPMASRPWGPRTSSLQRSRWSPSHWRQRRPARTWGRDPNGSHQAATVTLGWLGILLRWFILGWLSNLGMMTDDVPGWFGRLVKMASWRHHHSLKSCQINWLVVSIPLKNTSQLGWLFPTYGNHVSNHQPVKSVNVTWHKTCFFANWSTYNVEPLPALAGHWIAEERDILSTSFHYISNGWIFGI